MSDRTPLDRDQEADYASVASIVLATHGIPPIHALPTFREGVLLVVIAATMIGAGCGFIAFLGLW